MDYLAKLGIVFVQVCGFKSIFCMLRKGHITKLLAKQCVQTINEFKFEAATKVRVFAKQVSLFGKNSHLCGILS